MSNHVMSNEYKADSRTAIKFLRETLSIDILDVPGINKNEQVILAQYGITLPTHLVGHFFLCERDELKFIQFLRDLGLNEQVSRECAEKFNRKYGAL